MQAVLHAFKKAEAHVHVIIPGLGTQRGTVSYVGEEVLVLTAKGAPTYLRISAIVAISAAEF